MTIWIMHIGPHIHIYSYEHTYTYIHVYVPCMKDTVLVPRRYRAKDDINLVFTEVDIY